MKKENRELKSSLAKKETYCFNTNIVISKWRDKIIFTIKLNLISTQILSIANGDKIIFTLKLNLISTQKLSIANIRITSFKNKFLNMILFAFSK